MRLASKTSAAVSVRVSDGGIGYRVVGAVGPVLVLLHGVGSNSRSWLPQLTGLGPPYRLIAWDTPGYGQSVDPEPGWQIVDYAHALTSLVDELELETFHLVGHSMGGLIAVALCNGQPSRVRSLFLSDTYSGGVARAARGEPDRVEPRLAEYRSLPREEFVRRRLDRLLAPACGEEIREQAAEIMREVRSPGYEIANEALAAADLRPLLKHVHAPTTVACGELDVVTTTAEAQEIVAAIAGAQFETIAGAGHLSNQEQPMLYNRLLRLHLEKSGSTHGGTRKDGDGNARS